MTTGPLRQIVGLLGFDIDETSVRHVDQRLIRYQQRVAQVADAQSRMSLGLWTGIAAAVASNAWYQANSQYETLRASLDLVTGSAEGTEAALTAIQEFARISPDELHQVTAAYQMLLAQGIDPTTERLTRLGDTAAAVNADVATLIDAAAGATIGNTERLDVLFARFGFNFTSRQGVLFAQVGDELQRVGSTLPEIAAYLEELGRTRFEGGMARSAATMRGALSNLSDEFNKFLVQVGDEGLREELTLVIRNLATMTAEGDSLAAMLGRTLTRALRFVNSAIQWLVDNQHKVAQFLNLVGAWVAGSTLVRLIGLLRQVSMSMALIAAEAFAVQLAVGLAFFLAAVAIDDFFAFLQGRPSVIGVLVGEHGEAEGPLGELARFFTDLRDHGAAALGLLQEDVRAVWMVFQQMWTNLMNFGKNIGTALQPVRDFLEGIREQLDGLISPELQRVLDFLMDYNPMMQSPAARIARAVGGDFDGLTGGDNGGLYGWTQWLSGRGSEVGPDGRPLQPRFGASLPETMAATRANVTPGRIAGALPFVAPGLVGFAPGPRKEGTSVTVAPANVTITVAASLNDAERAIADRLRAEMPGIMQRVLEPVFERALAEAED